MNGVQSASHFHDHGSALQPRAVARPARVAPPPVQPRPAAQPPRRVDLREPQHPVYTIVHIDRAPLPPVVRDPIRVPPPINVTWQALRPYSQNITGQLFDFYDTDVEGD